MRIPAIRRVATTIAAFAVVFPAFGGESQGAQESPAAGSSPRSVTIFPIVLNSGAPIAGVSPDMSKKITELVGLMLERGRMREIEIADAKFTPPQDADKAKLAEAFAQFVQSRKIKTEFALFGQLIGTPGKGVDEIRLAVVDRQGKVVLAERLDRQQLAKKTPAAEGRVCPMTASYCLVMQLQSLWGLSDPNRQDSPQGKMAKLWDDKSGLPPKADREAMQSRLGVLKKNIKLSTIAVYPVCVSGKNDARLAARLAEMLKGASLGQAEAVSIDPKLNLQPNSNQTRVAWDMARAFQNFLRKNPPTADYALAAAYGVGRSPEGKPGVDGVQFVLCDRKGDWVLLDLKNDHHAEFRRINPRSADDCNRVVVEAMKNDLR
jgi:hypothetical protein